MYYILLTYRRRFALVNIFFHSTETEVVTEVPAYDFIDLAGRAAFPSSFNGSVNEKQL